MKAAIAISSVLFALTTATLWAQHPTESRPTTAPTPAPKTSTASTTADKPAATRPATAESAAERIMRRLDEAFPKKADAAKSDTRPRTTEPTTTESRTSGTGNASHASKRLTLNWRIALQWPEELCQAPIVK